MADKIVSHLIIIRENGLIGYEIITSQMLINYYVLIVIVDDLSMAVSVHI